MRILVAGSTGAVGRALVPLLVERGHRVGAIVRNERSAAVAEALGAAVRRADILDERDVRAAAGSFSPEVVVHQATALGAMTNLRKFSEGFRQTNELRTCGTAHLLDAARAAGARRFISQGYCGWPLARVGGPVKTEDDPLDPEPPGEFRDTFEALRTMERNVLGAGSLSAVVLRYGTFYGPGTSFARDGSFVRDVQRRKVPLIGAASGIFSFIHVHDVAGATVAAIEGTATGVFHVVDDDPAPIADWLPYLAGVLGAKRPMRLPGWLARILVPEHVYVLMTSARGCSNAKFKRTFGWSPTMPSWREGFQELAQAPLSRTA